MNEAEELLKQKAFDTFIDSKLYDKATDSIWKLVKSAYYDAWEKSRIFYSEENDQ